MPGRGGGAEALGRERGKLMELVAGTRVGRYEIEKTLVRDRASVTYLARQQEEVVEVTEYLPEKWATRGTDGALAPRSPEFKDAYEEGRARFLKEACALQNWFQDSGQPPHVAAVRTVFEARGTAYLITERVEGPSLEKTLDADGPKTAAWVWRMLDRLSADLASAHGAGIVHGAITPAHVRVRPDGVPVLVRFGVGRRAVATRTGQDDAVPEQMNGYAAIEQYEAGEKEPRTDVYALGAVAYRALSGKTPPAASARRNGESVKPLIAAAPALEDTGLAAAVMAALALEPAARPSDLAAWRVRLGLASPASEEDGAPEPPRPATDRWWKAAGVAAVAVLVAMVMVLATLFWRAQLAEQERARLAEQERARLAEQVAMLQDGARGPRVQSGRVHMDDDDGIRTSDSCLPGVEGLRGHINRRIDFPEPFVLVPEVIAAISLVDHYNDANLRLSVRVEEIDTGGFHYTFTTWCDTRLQSVELQWMAVAK